MDFVSDSLSMYLNQPSEIEAKFNSGGYLQVSYELEEVEGK